jgi:hypothetical protein
MTRSMRTQKKITALEKELAGLKEKNEKLKKAKEDDTKKVVDNLDQLILYDACLYGGRKYKVDPEYERKEKRSYIFRCVDLVNGQRFSTTHLNLYTNFELVKKEFLAGRMGGISEMAKETTEFLTYAKRMLTAAHKLHNKTMIVRDNALFLKKRQRCPFCRDRLYGPYVGDGEVLQNTGRPCFIKKNRPPQNDGFYFPTGCNRKLKLVEVGENRLMESMSLDATKPRVEFVDGFGFFDMSKDFDYYRESDSNDDPVMCCGKSCGQRCDIRNFPGFGQM